MFIVLWSVFLQWTVSKSRSTDGEKREIDRNPYRYESQIGTM